MARVNFPGNNNSHQTNTEREKRIKKCFSNQIPHKKEKTFNGFFLSLLEELDVSPNPMIKVLGIMKTEKKRKSGVFVNIIFLLFSANRLRRFSRSCFFEKSRELQSVLTVMPLFSIVVGSFSLSCFGHYPWFFVSFHHRGCHLSILKYI